VERVSHFKLAKSPTNELQTTRGSSSSDLGRGLPGGWLMMMAGNVFDEGDGLFRLGRLIIIGSKLVKLFGANRLGTNRTNNALLARHSPVIVVFRFFIVDQWLLLLHLRHSGGPHHVSESFHRSRAISGRHQYLQWHRNFVGGVVALGIGIVGETQLEFLGAWLAHAHAGVRGSGPIRLLGRNAALVSGLHEVKKRL